MRDKCVANEVQDVMPICVFAKFFLLDLSIGQLMVRVFHCDWTIGGAVSFISAFAFQMLICQ